MEYTFVMIRPGAFRRKRVDYILNRIDDIGLKVVYYDFKFLTPEFVYEHYAHLLDGSLPLDIFERTKIENLSGMVIGMIVSGDDSILKMRELIGPSNVKRAQEKFPYSIRALGDPNNNPDNLIHASDSLESAEIEIKRFFNRDLIDIINGIDIEEKPLVLKKEVV